MTERPAHPADLKSPGYEIFIGALSILSIVNLALRYIAQDENLDQVLAIMNGLLSLIFLIDFTYRLFTAESKTDYFFRQFGWADLLASLPFEQVKILRIFRLVRVGRLLYDYGAKNVARTLIKDRAGSALLTLLLMGILVLEFGSLEILNLEQYVPGGEHHDRRRCTLVLHRHHLDRRLRRPISGDPRRTPCRVAHHRHRGRHLRHLHRLPGQPVPRPVQEDRRSSGSERFRRCPSQARPAQAPPGPNTTGDR